jgi:Zn-dependent M28 family amino/carboxypeptidase
VRRTLTALTVATALVGAMLALPSAGASTPAWQKYPRPAVTGKQIADWDVSFASTYVGRITSTPQQLLAGQALIDELTGLGYTVTLEAYAGVLQAVTAAKEGTKHADESIVMGAHFDTLPQSVYGTYDNASGTAMVMALARSFAKVKTQRTMVFSFYNGEEEGALASDQQAQAYKDAKRKISAYLGFDMVGIAWPVGGTATDKNCLCMWRGSRDEDVEPLLAEVNYRFLRFPNARRKVSIEGSNVRNSDEASWASAGYRTLRWAGLRAADDYPQYHMPLDNPDTIDSVAGGRKYFEAGLRNTLLSAYYTAAALDTGR